MNEGASLIAMLNFDEHLRLRQAARESALKFLI
jgi:hypothetical protein